MTIIRVSPTRTYIIQIFSSDFTSIYFKQFTLPDKEENTCENATWYFYNRLDLFSCGREAYPVEMHMDIREVNENTRTIKTEEEIYTEQKLIEAIGRFNIEQRGILNTNMIQRLARYITDLKNEKK